MNYITLGRTDVKISSIALGTWQFGSGMWGFGKTYTKKDCVSAVKASLEAGVNLIDTAEVYGNGLSEKIVGEAVRNVKEEVFIATKVAPQHLTYNGVIRSCEKSLQRLGLKSIDLYQIHFPNPLIPIGQTMKAMEYLVKIGKIRYIGVSNFSLKKLQRARECLKSEDIVSNQVKYNLLERDIEKDLKHYCQREKITILAYSPLAQGLLTGKYRRNKLPRDIIRRINKLYTAAYVEKAEPLFKELEKIARRHSATMARISLAWVIGQGCVAIAGAKNSEQALDNALAGDLKLSDEEMSGLSQISETVKAGFADILKIIPRFFSL